MLLTNVGCDSAANASGDQAASAAADTTAAEWVPRAPLPEARTEVSVTADGERIYLIGGFGPAEGEERATAPRAMFAYDPTADRWTMPDSIPEGLNHAGFVHLDGKLYIIGGYRENTFDPIGAVHIYDLATRTWSEGTPMPTPRGALAVAVLDGGIHAVGGTAADAAALRADEHTIGADSSSVGTHEVYDPATDSWTRLAPMPTARNHLGAGAMNGNIYAFAGRVGDNSTLTQNEIYDPATDSWSQGAPVPTGRSGVAVATLGPHLYLFGGETFGAEEKTFGETERYDPPADRWESLPPMPTSRHGLGAATFGSSIYVIAGGPEPGFTFSRVNERLTP